jgi:hypothetical protein
MLVFFALFLYRCVIASAPENNCGIISLWNVCQLSGVIIDLQEVQTLFPENSKEVSLYDIKKAAEIIGLRPTGARIGWEELLDLNVPVIAWVNKSHFLVVERRMGKGVLTLDCSQSCSVYNRDQLEEIWSGEVIIFYRSSSPLVEADLTQRVYFNELRYDFGPFLNNDITSHTFELANIGGKPLLIKEVKSCCNCQAKITGKKIINPGEKSTISVDFYLHENVGLQKCNIDIIMNDPLNPNVTLTLTGYKPRDVWLSSSLLYFNNVLKGKSVKREFYVFVESIDDITLQEVNTPSSLFKLNHEYDPYDSEDIRRWKVNVELKPQNDPGELKSKILIKTNSEINPIIEIPVTIRVISDISVYPPKPFLGILKKKQKTENMIRIHTISHSPFTIKNIDVRDLPIRVTFDKDRSSEEHNIILELKEPGAAPGFKNGVIDALICFSERNDSSVMTIPIMWFVEK